MISRHPSHLSHSPSVRTVRSEESGGPFDSESRLNHDIGGVNDHDSTPALFWGREPDRNLTRRRHIDPFHVLAAQSDAVTARRNVDEFEVSLGIGNRHAHMRYKRNSIVR